MTRRTGKPCKPMTGEELGNKLLQSVRQMKEGKAARVTRVASDEIAAADQKP